MRALQVLDVTPTGLDTPFRGTDECRPTAWRPFTAMPVVLVVCAVLATYLPARRAVAVGLVEA